MNYAFAIEPVTYTAFEDEAAQLEQCRGWGLLSEKAAKTKAFFYKRNGLNLSCRVVGFVDPMTAVIELENGQKHCIHPSYLKEMQAAQFGQKSGGAAEETAAPERKAPEEASAESAAQETVQAAVQEAVQDELEEEAPASQQAKADPAETGEEAAKDKGKKEKPRKVQLPEEKVKMKATVKEFATVPNHFSDNDDEVVIYEAVAITEPETELGTAWSSYSATLKKLELNIGDTLTFEAKVIAKKLTKHPVPYKINNPAKIQKEG